MKWTYKECEVEITAIYDMSANVTFTPIVEIDCKDANGSEYLTSSKLFASAMEAELYGQRMAKEWIDEHRLSKATARWPVNAYRANFVIGKETRGR
jgi:hypothetical protein